MSKNIKIQWLSAPEEHDYPAAESYLSLIYDKRAAAKRCSRGKVVFSIPLIWGQLAKKPQK